MKDKTLLWAVVNSNTGTIQKGDHLIEKETDKYDLVDGYEWRRFVLKPYNPPKERSKARFNGAVYDPYYDDDRLTKQLGRVWSALWSTKKYQTLEELADKTNDPPASISAQLRHLRKERFGSYIIDKQPRGERGAGLWEYKLID